MENLRFVGLDVHKDSIVIAVAEGLRGTTSVLGTFPHDFTKVLKQLKKLSAGGREVRCCYEAGPTGFVLCRVLREAGFDCIVVAPSLVPVRSGDRVKTDKRDALKLARFLRSGDLTAIHIPEPETEAMRDLSRARDAAKRAQRSAQQQLIKFLLRHGRPYEGKAGTVKHLKWAKEQHFEHEAHRHVLSDYVRTTEVATERVAQLDKDIAALVQSWSLKPLVTALQAMRGIALHTAVVLAAEIGDFTRFGKPSKLMAYVGLVPREHSSGENVRRGGITKCGNTHVRHVLVEAAHHYRRPPSRSPELKARSKGVSPEVEAIAWKAQQRLHRRRNTMLAKGKGSQKTVIAVARELAGFVWAIATQPQLSA